MKTFLLEVGTEEIPARFMEPAKEGLSVLLRDGLAAERITFDGIVAYATPRRIAVFINNIADKQKESVTVKHGPPLNRAYDESGKPTKAAIGFAKSQNVAVEELKRLTKDGVDFVGIERKETGREIKDVLPGLLQDVISRIPFQKRMRWGNESFEFARPIQWILAILEGEVIAFGIADVTSGGVTYGLRFLSQGPVSVRHPSEYIEQLKEHYVFVKEDERAAIIAGGISRIEEETGGTAIRDEDLAKEILYITEYPYPLKGNFDHKFLEIPKEVLVNVMKSHQKYIPLQDGNGRLLPHFIFFANTRPVTDSEIIRGNEKVLRARLADAEFFFHEDKKTGLADLYERLSTIVFHVKIGTLQEKTERVRAITQYLAASVGYEYPVRVDRVIRLIKSDLLTHMVGEFPELQGIMGRIYAQSQGEEEEVALCVEEHYLPSGSDATTPRTTLGTIVGIADKIDSLVSFFSVGITPTGNLDPYALRRQAIGIMKIINDRGLHIPLQELIKKAYESGGMIPGRLSLDETTSSLTDFITTRFKFFMIEEGHNQDFVESVLVCAGEDLYDGYLRLVALENQKSLEDFGRLMIGFKRVFNITKQLTGEFNVDRSALILPEEGALHDLYEMNKETFLAMIQQRRYDDALSILVSFKEAVDNYFDKVFVMDKDETIKNNRLALLKKIKDMFMKYSDFSKIRIE